MSRIGSTSVVAGALVFVGLVTVALAPAQASVCNGFVQFDYIGGSFSAAVINDTFRVRLTLFTDGITEGTNNVLQVDRVRFGLDCSVDSPLLLPCVDDGSVMTIQGDITSNQCNDKDGNPVAFSASTTSGNFAPNEVIFTPSAAIVIPSDTVAAVGCQLEFDIQVATHSNDSTPNRVEEVAGYRVESGVPDAHCDNGLSAFAVQSSAVVFLEDTPTPTFTPTVTPTTTATSTTSASTPTFTATNTPTETAVPIPTPTSAGPGCGTIRKSHTDLNAGDFHPGTLVRFRITYNNVCRAGLANLIDALPPGLSFVSATNDGIFSNGSVIWSGTTLLRRALTVSFVALINPDVVPSTVIQNDVTLFDAQGRTITASDFVQTLRPGQSGPPPITLTAKAPLTSRPGRIMTATFTYKNLDYGGTFSVVLPPGETFLSAVPAPATIDGNILTWSGGALRLPNASVKVRVQVALDAPPGMVLSHVAALNMVGGQVQSAAANTVVN